MIKTCNVQKYNIKFNRNIMLSKHPEWVVMSKKKCVHVYVLKCVYKYVWCIWCIYVWGRRDVSKRQHVRMDLLFFVTYCKSMYTVFYLYKLTFKKI